MTSFAMRICVLSTDDRPQAARLREAFGAADRLFAGADVVHLYSDRASLPGLAVRATLARAHAVLLSPLFPPTALPWWGRRFHRIVLPSQRVARAWAAVVPLGRLVVVEPGPRPDPSLAPRYVAGPADADDPERIVAAAAAGASVHSTVEHDVLPPGATGAAGCPGPLARAWASRGRTPEDERRAFAALYAEVVSMSRRR